MQVEGQNITFKSQAPPDEAVFDLQFGCTSQGEMWSRLLNFRLPLLSKVNAASFLLEVRILFSRETQFSHEMYRNLSDS